MGSVRPKHLHGARPIYNADTKAEKTANSPRPQKNPGPTEPVPPSRNARQRDLKLTNLDLFFLVRQHGQTFRTREGGLV